MINGLLSRKTIFVVNYVCNFKQSITSIYLYEGQFNLDRHSCTFQRKVTNSYASKPITFTWVTIKRHFEEQPPINHSVFNEWDTMLVIENLQLLFLKLFTTTSRQWMALLKHTRKTSIENETNKSVIICNKKEYILALYFEMLETYSKFVP